MRAAVVTIGTEITDGQIVDRNSSWISRRLDQHNIRAVLHTSVPDEKNSMLDALRWAAGHAELIFVCGGLGPTSDDFTREAVSEHLNLPLNLDEESWRRIQEKLGGRSVVLREGHKRQAMMPHGSHAMENDHGVAPGFYFTQEDKHYWVLPGPPKEIEAIWNRHVDGQLAREFRVDREMLLKTWLCLGAPESELAHLTETHFTRYPFRKEFGYRLNVPYVEIKLWHQPSHPDLPDALHEFEQMIKPWFVAENTGVIQRQFTESLKKFSALHFFDEVTDGALAQKLGEILGEDLLRKTSTHTFFAGQKVPSDMAALPGLHISLLATEAGQTELVVENKGRQKRMFIPLFSKRTSTYNKLYALERALLEAPSTILMIS